MKKRLLTLIAVVIMLSTIAMVWSQAGTKVNTKGGNVSTKSFTSPTVTKTSEIHIMDGNGKPMDLNEINRMMNKIPACPVSAMRMKCDFNTPLLSNNKEIGLSSKQLKSIKSILSKSSEKTKKLQKTAENESKRLIDLISSKTTQKKVDAQVTRANNAELALLKEEVAKCMKIKPVLTDKQLTKLLKLSTKTSSIKINSSSTKAIPKTSKK